MMVIMTSPLGSPHTCASCRDADGHGTSRRGDGRLFRPALPATSSAAAAFAEATAPWCLRGRLGRHLGGLALLRNGGIASLWTDIFIIFTYVFTEVVFLAEIPVFDHF